MSVCRKYSLTVARWPPTPWSTRRSAAGTTPPHGTSPASSYVAQNEYAKAAPPYVHVPYEVIEQWEDWVPHLDLVLTDSNVYTPKEKEVLSRFQSVWELTIEAIGHDFPSLDAVQAMPAWEDMRLAAAAALAVLAKRGRLPED